MDKYGQNNKHGWHNQRSHYGQQMQDGQQGRRGQLGQHSLHQKKIERKHGMIRTFFSLSSKLFISWIIILAAAGATFLVFFFQKETVIVPDLLEKDVVEALLELQSKNLYGTVEERVNELLQKKGLVISQDPNPGISVREGRHISLVVSKGSSVSVVPNFVGTLLEDIYHNYEAFQGLGNHFDIAQLNKVFDESPAGSILGQDPKANTVLTTHFTPIHLVVSRGTKEDRTILPDLVGLEFTEVFSYIEANNVEFNFYFVEDATVVLDTENDEQLLQAGVIVDQSPNPGDSIDKEDKLYIGLRRMSTKNKNYSQSTESKEQADEKVQYSVGFYEVSLPRYQTIQTIRVLKNLVKARTQDNAQTTEDAAQKSNNEAETIDTEIQQRLKAKYLQFESQGGLLRFPYFVKPGDSYAVEVAGVLIWRARIPGAVTKAEEAKDLESTSGGAAQ